MNYNTECECGGCFDLNDISIRKDEHGSYFEMRLICPKCGKIKDVKGGRIEGSISNIFEG